MTSRGRLGYSVLSTFVILAMLVPTENRAISAD
jgi:hypothetical protein